MPKVKVSSKVEEQVWTELQAIAAETGGSISSHLTEAIREYLARRRVRPEVMSHLEKSMDRNDELGRLLAE